MFTDSYLPYVSGVVVSLHNAVKELERRGNTVVVCAPDYPSAVGSDTIIRFPSVASTYPGFRIALPFSIEAWHHINRRQVDLVHVHSPFLMGVAGAAFAWRHKLPLVFTHHTRYDQYVHYAPLFPRLIRRLTSSYVKWFCQRCDLIIVPTEEIGGLLQAQGIERTIEVVPSGVETERFQSGDADWLRRTFALPKSAIVLLYVGRLTKEKNLHMLLAAFTYAASECEGFLVLVGSGPEKNALQAAAAAAGIEERVIFAGPRYGSELVNCYHGADLFVFASTTETQGLVLLEAMAAGLPVVAVNASGSREMIEDQKSGILTANHPMALAAAMVKLIKNEGFRHQTGAQAAARSLLFSNQAAASRLVDCYRVLLAGRRETPSK